MKNKSITFKFLLKIITIQACFINPVSSNAQSLAGKWKMTAAKETVTDKASGKAYDLSAQIGDITKMTEQIIEFHADHTYFTSNTLIGDKKSLEASGSYSISGNQLKLQMRKNNLPAIDTKSSNPMNSKLPPVMTIVSQSNNILVLQYGTETTDKGKIYIMDVQDTFTKQ